MYGRFGTGLAGTVALQGSHGGRPSETERLLVQRRSGRRLAAVNGEMQATFAPVQRMIDAHLRALREGDLPAAARTGGGDERRRSGVSMVQRVVERAGGVNIVVRVPRQRHREDANAIVV